MHKLLEIYNRVNHFGRHLNMSLEVLAPGKIEYTMPIGDIHLSSPLAVHGGAVAGLMDAILGVTALSKSVEDGQLVSTVEFKINYFYPVLPNDILIGRGTIDFEGKKLISVSGEIWRQSDGRVMAKGNGTFNKYSIEKVNFPD